MHDPFNPEPVELAERHEAAAEDELRAAEVISTIAPGDIDQLNMVSVILAKAQAHATLAISYRLAAQS